MILFLILFYDQVTLTKNIPFIHRNFNEQTLKAIQEVDQKENLTNYDNFGELRKELEV